MVKNEIVLLDPYSNARWGGQRLFEQYSKKLHFSYGTASLTQDMESIPWVRCASGNVFFFQSNKFNQRSLIGLIHYECAR